MHALIPMLLALTLAGAVTQADVERLLDAQLPRTAGADSLHWSLAAGWPSVSLPQGATRLELQGPHGELRTGAQPCMLRVLGGGRVLRAIPFAARCERTGAGLRATRALPVGAVLTGTDVELVRGPVPAGDRPLGSVDAALARRLRRSLPAGAWLTAACVETPALVRSGTALDVTAGSPQLQVRFRAVAQQPGSLGDVIRARGPRPGAPLKVKLTGPGVATLVP